MANPRLLMLVGGFSLLAAGCYRLPETLEMPEVRGRVVDAETDQPIAGAEVFVWLLAESKAPLAIGSAKLGAKSQTTNDNGEFAFPAGKFVVPQQVRRWWRLLSPLPGVASLHRDYGWSGTMPDRAKDLVNLTLRMSRNSFLLELRGPGWTTDSNLSEWCGGLSDVTYEIRSTVLRPYYRCCEVVFGAGVPMCRDPGPRSEEVLRELEKAYE